ncbi:MAG: sel1 repeat family protein [Lysobacter sp.]|nr:sel1 repeat family protein [Lysobacter sp.]
MKKIVLPALVVAVVAVAAWVYSQRERVVSPPSDEIAPTETPSPSAQTTTSAGTDTQAQSARPSLADTQHLNRKVEITSINLAKDWAQLQETAKTDPAFAYALVLKLFECKMVANTFGGIEKLNSKTVAANQNASGLSDDIKAKAAVCADLTQTQYMAYVDMIEFAAASGVIKAQAEYSTFVAASLNMTPDIIKNPRVIDEYKAKSMRYYHSAAQSGYAPALQNLSFAYSDGILTPKDDYAAYKYLLATNLAAARGSPSRDKLLVRFQSGLTPQQIASAQREAIAIYNACCRK